jgi:hypothetical protein
MSKRVTQSWAAAGYWLVASAGVTGIISLSVAVFMTPPQRQEITYQTSDGGASIHLAQRSAAEPINANFELASKQRAITALVVPQRISTPHEVPPVNVNLALIDPAPIAAPKTHEAIVIQAQANTPQKLVPRDAPTTTALIPVQVATLAPPLTPKAVQPAFTTTHLTAPQSQAIQPIAPRQVETVVVSGYQQMALNVDGIGRGNSLTIQLPRANRK